MNNDDEMAMYHRQQRFSPKPVLKEKQVKQVPEDKPKQDEDVKHIENHENGKERHKIPREDQFIMTHFKELDDKELLKGYRSPFLLYLKIRSYIVRAPFEGDLGLYEKYWKKGVLASTRSLIKLANDFGYSRKRHEQIRRWVHKLVEDGFIKLDSVDVGKEKNQFVFVFGKHNSGADNDYKEYFFKYDIKDNDQSCSIEDAKLVA